MLKCIIFSALLTVASMSIVYAAPDPFLAAKGAEAATKMAIKGGSYLAKEAGNSVNQGREDLKKQREQAPKNFGEVKEKGAEIIGRFKKGAQDLKKKGIEKSTRAKEYAQEKTQKLRGKAQQPQ